MIFCTTSCQQMSSVSRTWITLLSDASRPQITKLLEVRSCCTVWGSKSVISECCLLQISILDISSWSVLDRTSKSPNYLTRDHERPPWWKTALMSNHPDWDHPDENPPWYKPPWWLRDHPNEWHPDERLPGWETSLKRDCPDERPAWREAALMRDHHKERPP